MKDLARHKVGVARRGEENITRSALGRLTRSVDERNSSGTVVLDLAGRSGSGLTEEEDERKWVVSRVGKNGRRGRGEAHLQRRVDGAWRNSVDTDTLGRKLDRERAGEREDGALRACVRNEPSGALCNKPAESSAGLPSRLVQREASRTL